jgi:hypothetical protein
VKKYSFTQKFNMLEDIFSFYEQFHLSFAKTNKSAIMAASHLQCYQHCSMVVESSPLTKPTSKKSPDMNVKSEF